MTTPHERMERQTTISVHRLLIGIIICLALMLAGVVFLLVDREQVRDDSQTAETNARNLAVQVQEACNDPTVPLSVTFCRQAEQVEQAPTETIPGPQGEPGPPGPMGPRGFQGFEGPQGPAGPPGPVGEMGPPGTDGAVGPAGEPGEAGATGPQGVAGEPGGTGPQGEVGPAGAEGPAGEQGPAGSDGADGADGRGIVSVTIEGDPMDCQLVVTYTSGEPDRIPINPLICLR